MKDMDGISPLMKQRLHTIKTLRTVRWYVLWVPHTCKDVSRQLQFELNRRFNQDDTLFDFFAPNYVKTVTVEGKKVKIDRPLLYNYVFIHASEEEIIRIKSRVSVLCFLPRAKKGNSNEFPYVSPTDMDNFRLVANAYSNELPAFTPDPSELVRGDRIRITAGPFAGVEASLLSINGTKRKTAYVSVEGCMFVPILQLEQGEFEYISFNAKGKRAYTQLSDENTLNSLHQALLRVYTPGGVTEADRRIASECLCTLGRLQMDTALMRSRLYAALLMAHTILGNESEKIKLVESATSVLDALQSSPQYYVLLATALLGCTGNGHYHNRAHAIVDSWSEEEKNKKIKRAMLKRLADYDNIFHL